MKLLVEFLGTVIAILIQPILAVTGVIFLLVAQPVLAAESDSKWAPGAYVGLRFFCDTEQDILDIMEGRDLEEANTLGKAKVASRDCTFLNALFPVKLSYWVSGPHVDYDGEVTSIWAFGNGSGNEWFVWLEETE